MRISDALIVGASVGAVVGETIKATGRVTVDPLSNVTDVIAKALPTMVESELKVIEV